MVKGPWFWVKRLLGEIMGHLGLSYDFQKEVPKMLGFWLSGQLEKV